MPTLLNIRDSDALIAEWAGRYQANVRRILELMHTCFEIVPKAQAEMAKLLGEPFAPYSNEMQRYLSEFTTAPTAGTQPRLQ